MNKTTKLNQFAVAVAVDDVVDRHVEVVGRGETVELVICLSAVHMCFW